MGLPGVSLLTTIERIRQKPGTIEGNLQHSLPQGFRAQLAQFPFGGPFRHDFTIG
jgi:hypothetical protein